jgi:hypothetical protein
LWLPVAGSELDKHLCRDLSKTKDPTSKGRREKQMTKVTHICCSAKKQVVTCSILFLFLFFYRFFLTRFLGVS